MKKYWPLLLIGGLLAAIICMSQYADSAKNRYAAGAKHTEDTSVAKGDNGHGGNNTEKPYEPPVWAKFVTWPEGVGAWAVILTLLAIVWQSVETRRAADAAIAGNAAAKTANSDTLAEIRRQADLMEKQARIMRSQLTIPYRAHLAAREISGTPNDIRILIPIENYGHVEATITSVSVTLVVTMSGKEVYNRRNTQPVGGDAGKVAPGKSGGYHIDVFMPPETKQGRGDTVQVWCTIGYKTGFRDKLPDTLYLVHVWEWETSKWLPGLVSVRMDFAETK